jgi:hypothetical protein
MANILHLAHNMDEDDAPDTIAPDISPPPISAFVAVGRGSQSGRGHHPRGPRGGRGLPSKCSACGSLDHIMSSCTAPDDALQRWTIAKGKMIIQKYGAHGGSHSAHAALMSDVPADDSDSLPTLEECTDEIGNWKLFTTCAGKLDRLLSLGPLYFAIHDLLASWARVSLTRYTYRHTYLQCVSTFLRRKL